MICKIIRKAFWYVKTSNTCCWQKKVYKNKNIFIENKNDNNFVLQLFLDGGNTGVIYSNPKSDKRFIKKFF